MTGEEAPRNDVKKRRHCERSEATPKGSSQIIHTQSMRSTRHGLSSMSPSGLLRRLWPFKAVRCKYLSSYDYFDVTPLDGVQICAHVKVLLIKDLLYATFKEQHSATRESEPCTNH